MQKDAFLFGTHVTSASVAVLQPIEWLNNCQGHHNLEDFCKLVHMAKKIEIGNQNMLTVCNWCAQGKHTIDINHQVASQVELVYNLLYLDLLWSITPVGYDSSKYAAFLSDELSGCQ